MVRVITLDLFIPGAETIKDKRQVIKSLVEKIRHKFNVSIAETGYHDLWQRSQLELACVANESTHLNEVQQAILKLIESLYPVEITNLSVADY
ncbi:MAG TPA: DUF503 domain-containing protein [Bacillota bacterium]|nr:DUF503 domain-containing protein [Bacillota bacterium]